MATVPESESGVPVMWRNMPAAGSASPAPAPDRTATREEAAPKLRTMFRLSVLES